MNKEPTFFYVFRFLFGCGLLTFMVMLYWSSVLVEENLKIIQGDLLQLKSQINAIKNEEEKNQIKWIESNSITDTHTSLIPNSPEKNLLTMDPFLKTTLPKLLGTHFKPHGIHKEASISKPDHLHPFSNWSEVSTWTSLCTVAIAGQEIGKYETYTPDMALSMELRNSPDGISEYWITLRKDVFWHPLTPTHFPNSIELAPFFLRKHQVTAHDFKFYYDAIMNPHVEEAGAVALRNYLNDIEEIRIEDDFTLVVRWKVKEFEEENGQKSFKIKFLSKALTAALRPLPCFVYQYFPDGTKIITEDEDPATYLRNPVWAQNFSHHWANNIIVSCGPWLFDGMTDREIRFIRNPDFYESYAALTDRYEIKFRESVEGMWEDFKLGSLDLFGVPPNLLRELDFFLTSEPYQKQSRKGWGIKKVEYLGRNYNYIGWNETNPLFKNAQVRQALTMAIDRERIIRQNLNGKGQQITGTFFPNSPSYDSSISPYPFDPDRARQLLQEEGWFDNDGDGIVDKLISGKQTPFKFTLNYYVKDSLTKTICEYVSTALKQIGISCTPNGVDIADLSAIFQDKSFDALLLGWDLGTPPEDPKQIWYSTGAKEKGSSNAISFANHEVDRIIDQLEYEYDPEKRVSLYHRFDKIIHEEAPYTFLYTPKVTVAYRDYLKNVFVPAHRQDLIPGANVGEPQPSIFWIAEN